MSRAPSTKFTVDCGTQEVHAAANLLARALGLTISEATIMGLSKLAVDSGLAGFTGLRPLAWEYDDKLTVTAEI